MREMVRKMVCPIGGGCSEVVESKYGKTFGFDNDILGILYYIAIGAAWSVLLVWPDLSAWVLRLIVIAVSGAFVFTNYLLYVQLFILKKECFWCVIAAFVNYALFFSVLWQIL